MSDEELAQGRRWVEQEIARVSRERGVKIRQPIKWQLDFDHSVYWIEAVFDDATKRWEFSNENLEDSVNDHRVRRQLQNAIAFFVPHGTALPSDSDSLQSGPTRELASEGRNTAPRLLQAFLCYSRFDKQTVRALYRKLVDERIHAWFDEVDLVPGQDWELEIGKAVRGSDVALVCLTPDSVTTPGFAQKEIKFALDVADEQPEGAIYVIPVRLAECEVPDRLSRRHWVNLFEEDGFAKLMTALRRRATELGITLVRRETSARHEVVTATPSPAEKLKAAFEARERERARKQQEEEHQANLERATLASAPEQFEALAERLRLQGEALASQRLPGALDLKFEPVNHRLDAGSTYSVQLMPYTQLRSFTTILHVGLSPDARQSHVEVPNVKTISRNFRAHTDDSGFSWLDEDGQKWTPDQIIDFALDKLTDLIVSEPDSFRELDQDGLL